MVVGTRQVYSKSQSYTKKTWIFLCLQHWQDDVTENLGYLKTSGACCCWNEANEKENTTFFIFICRHQFHIICLPNSNSHFSHKCEKSLKFNVFQYKGRNRNGKTNVLLLFSSQIILYEFRKVITQFSGEWPLLSWKMWVCVCVWHNLNTEQK